jgi:transcriptional regulator with XRE-family HTH domain
MAKMEAAAYLRVLRDRLGISQEALGDAIGVSKRQVQNWEGGHNIPGIEHLTIVLRYLGGSIDTYADLLMNDQINGDTSKLAEQPVSYEDKLQAEVIQRLKRLRRRSPELAQQFADYGRFLDEFV